MSSAIVLNEKFENVGTVALPETYSDIHSHNLYLTLNRIKQHFVQTPLVLKVRVM